MRRCLTMLMGLGLLLAPIGAHAETTCWSALPFVDVFRAPGYSIIEASPLTVAIPAWSETGATSYVLKGVSVSMPSVPPGFPFNFTVYMHNETSFFGANPNCQQTVRLNAAGVGQAETFCDGGPGIPFSITLNLTPASCSTVLAVSLQRAQQGVTLAGAVENNEYQP